MRYCYHGYYLDEDSKDRVMKVLAQIDDVEKELQILDILELHEVSCLIQNEALDWLEDSEEVSNNLKRIIGIFFTNLSERNIVECFDVFNVDDDTFFRYDYFNVFAHCFDKFKIYKKISELHFKDILINSHIPLRCFLNHQCYRVRYQDSIKSCFLNDARNIELLVDYCTKDYVEYKLPLKISSQEYSDLLDEYLELNTQNLSCLQLISGGIKKINQFFSLNPEQMVKAKVKADEILKEMEKSNQIFRTSQEIAIFKNYDEYSSSNCSYKSLIDIEWLSKYNDPMDLLNYFRAIDWMFVDGNILGVCSYPNREMTTLDKLFHTRTLEHYEFNMVFSCKNLLVLATILHYQEFLKEDKNQSIEEMLDYFYNTYLPEKRDVKFLNISFPNADYTIQLKTRELLIKHELICKQTKELLEKQHIDIRIINRMSKPDYSEIQVPKPMFFSINDESDCLKDILYLLFNDQSGIRYINKDLKGSDFCELIKDNTVKITDFHEYQQEKVLFLIKNEIISVVDNSIVLTDQMIFTIHFLKNLYSYGSISTNLKSHVSLLAAKSNLPTDHVRKLVRNSIDFLFSKEYIIESRYIFTKNESNYLEYILSDKHYDNSLGIRNKYVHGNIVEDENWDYAYSLLVSVFTALRLEMYFEQYMGKKD